MNIEAISGDVDFFSLLGEKIYVVLPRFTAHYRSPYLLDTRMYNTLRLVSKEKVDAVVAEDKREEK